MPNVKWTGNWQSFRYPNCVTATSVTLKNTFVSSHFFGSRFMIFFVEIQVWVGLKMHFNQVLFPTIYKVVHNIWNTQYKTDTSILYLSLMTNDSAEVFYLIWTFYKRQWQIIVFLRNLFFHSSRILTKSSIYPFEEKTKEENVQSYPSKEVRYTNIPTKVSIFCPKSKGSQDSHFKGLLKCIFNAIDTDNHKSMQVLNSV